MTDAPIVKRKRSRLAEANEAFKAGANGTLTRQDVETVVVQTRRGLRAAAPMLMEALIEKALKGRGSPADTKALMFALAGSGVTQTGAPVTETERRAMDAENERLEATPTAELSKKVHFMAGIEPVPEPK